MERQLKITHFVSSEPGMYIYGKMWRGFDVDKLRFPAMAEKSQLAVGFNCFSYRFKKINPNSVTWHPFAREGNHHNS